MIRCEMGEQDAVDVHGLLTRMQDALDGQEELVASIRALRLSLAGGLRAAGWTPSADGEGWEKRAVGRRR